LIGEILAGGIKRWRERQERGKDTPAGANMPAPAALEAPAADALPRQAELPSTFGDN